MIEAIAKEAERALDRQRSEVVREAQDARELEQLRRDQAAVA